VLGDLNAADDLDDGRVAAEADLVAVPEVALPVEADVLFVHERTVRRSRVFDLDRSGDGVDDECRMARRNRRVRERNVDLLAGVCPADGLATAMERPEVALRVRLIRDEKTAERVRREVRSRGRRGSGLRLRGTEGRSRSRSAEALGLLTELGLRSPAESALLTEAAALVVLRGRFGTEATGLRRRSTEAALLRGRSAEPALLRRRAESTGLLAVASSVLRVRIRERSAAGLSVLRLTAEAGLRRRSAEPTLLLLLAVAAAAVLIVRERHRVERDGMTVRAVARARSDVVAHLAAQRRGLSRRCTVRSLRRRRAEAALLRRREALPRCSERGGHDGRTADVAKLVRRLRDRAALRTGVHRESPGSTGVSPMRNRSISEKKEKAE